MSDDIWINSPGGYYGPASYDPQHSEHAPGCACPVGGDRLIVRCEWCNRDTSDGDYVNVSRGQDVVRCCSSCWEKGDEGVDIPLDYTEDEPLREGLPEFNGAFKSW